MGKDRSSTGPYLKEIDYIPVLTHAQEIDLADRIANGDPEAREILIRSNLRLVVHVAKKFRGRGLHIDDLVEEGILGLIRATESYDKSYGVRFSTYSVYWIRQCIQRAIMNSTRVVKLPFYLISLITKYNDAKCEFDNRNEAVDDNKMIKILDINKKTLKLIRRAIELSQVHSTDNHYGLSDPLESVPDRSQEKEESESTNKLLRNVDKLSPRENDVIRMRFGLGCDELTLAEIGRIFGVSKERIRQVEEQALSKLAVWHNT